MISAANAYIFVFPEYNFGFTAHIKNVIDYLFHEWAYKALGSVSFGGLVGGTRGNPNAQAGRNDAKNNSSNSVLAHPSLLNCIL